MGILTGNGDESRRKELMDEQFSQGAHQNMQSQAISHALQNQPVLNQRGQIREEYLQTLIDSGVDEATAGKLKSLLSRDLVLSYMEAAEVNEVRWLVRLLQKKFHTLHPPEGSVMQGEYRAFLSDDEDDNLVALSDTARLLVDQTIMVVVSRVARSKQGWQQEETSRVYTVSEAKQDKENKGRRIFG